MELPQIPSFDQAVLDGLRYLGVNSALIIFLVATVFALQSWYDASKRIFSASKGAATATRRAVTASQALKPIRVLTASFTTIIMLDYQILKVWSFVISC